MLTMWCLYWIKNQEMEVRRLNSCFVYKLMLPHKSPNDSAERLANATVLAKLDNSLCNTGQGLRGYKANWTQGAQVPTLPAQHPAQRLLVPSWRNLPPHSSHSMVIFSLVPRLWSLVMKLWTVYILLLDLKSLVREKLIAGPHCNLYSHKDPSLPLSQPEIRIFSKTSGSKGVFESVYIATGDMVIVTAGPGARIWDRVVH